MDDRDDAAAWAAPAPVSPDSPPIPAPAAAVSGWGPAPTDGWAAGPPAPAASSPYAAAHAAAPTSASWQPGFMPLRPLGFGDLLGLPFRAMRYNRSVVVGGPLLLTLGATALLAVGMWLGFRDASLLFTDPTQAGSFSLGGTTIAVLVIGLVAALLADVLSSAIVAPGVARGVLGERIRLADAWHAVRPRIGALLLLYVVATVGLLAVVTLGLLPLILTVANGAGAGAIVASVLLVIVVAVPAAAVVTLVGGIARPVIVLEQRRTFAGLRRTIGLLKGRFWWSLLVVFVATVLIGAVSGVVSNLGSGVGLVVGFAAPDNGILLGIAFVLSLVLSLVVSYVLTYSFMGSLFALLLIDLRIRNEGFDLTLAEAAEARRA
ncbi:hypothetical protein [Demequina soli]|uniref:hypothetical protein n=1 Tax=Demequina soli TaxID=1638987 RepID=UPI00078504F8|nr:hypothetical protein [Demequina soli]